MYEYVLLGRQPAPYCTTALPSEARLGLLERYAVAQRPKQCLSGAPSGRILLSTGWSAFCSAGSGGATASSRATKANPAADGGSLRVRRARARFVTTFSWNYMYVLALHLSCK